jgi:hypothetical protein
MVDLRGQRNELNLNLPDYLGDYEPGTPLVEIGGYQPPEGVSDSYLSSTSEAVEGLRVGSIKIVKDSSKLVIKLTAWYKPENEDEHETDQWGYTETEFIPAMEFVGLDNKLERLIAEFVPYAVDEAGGYAGFREKATTTNSLIDRLGDIVLPKMDDIGRGFERYLNTKNRADTLDEKINKTDELIDEVVYNLYGLSDDEVEIIESSIEK